MAEKIIMKKDGKVKIQAFWCAKVKSESFVYGDWNEDL